MNHILQENNDLVEELHALRSENTVLKNAELRFRKLVEQSRDGIVILSENCKVFDANQKFADMLGYTLEEVYNLYVWDWDKTLSPEQLQGLAKDVDEKGHHFESIHTRKDNTTYDVELSNSGTIVGGKKLIFCICRNVSDRKRSETRLHESQELLSTFIDNFKGIAYQVPVEQFATFTPRLFRGAIEQITGYTDQDFASLRTWNTIIHPDDITHVQNERKKCLESPETEAEIQYRITAKSGDILWMKENARLVKIGKDKLLHGTIFNITQQKNAEEEKCKLEEQVRHSQKLEAIGTLAGGVAHDFNNILFIIMGYTDLILKTVPSQTSAHSHLIQIQKASIRAKDIIQQLLTFGRKVEIKKLPIDIEPIISEALTFLRSTLPSNIEIHQHFHLANEMILADPTQMHQVIMNLCVNAAQALQNKGGTIKVTITSEYISISKNEACRNLPDGKYIKIDVTDDGPGIQPEIAGRIFDPYFTTRENGKGSGMGLAVVHGIVKNHDGCITMTSKPEQGATFTVYLPVVKSESSTFRSRIKANSTGVESILFVDDEEDITIIGKLTLENHGFRVKAEVNPLNALDTFKKHPADYDLIFTDMTMPKMTGDTFCKEIRKIRPDIPVILFTGHSDYINEEEALKTGISAFVHKPVNSSDLINIVRTVIDKKKSS